jgi:hypothetical protein
MTRSSASCISAEVAGVTVLFVPTHDGSYGIPLGHRPLSEVGEN